MVTRGWDVGEKGRLKKKEREKKIEGWLPGVVGRRVNSELVFNEDRASVCKMKSVLEMDGSDGCTTIWM